MTAELTKWEYCFFIKQTEMYLMMELHDAGKEGWELVSVSFNKDLKNVWNWTAFLKRPIGPWSDTSHKRADAGALRKPAVLAEMPPEGAETPAEPDAKPEPGGPLQGFDLSDGDFEFKD